MWGVKMRKMLAILSIMSFMILGQVIPAFASVDGQLYKTTVSGAPMKMSNSAGSTTLMNMGLNEALAHRAASTNGYEFYWGRNAGGWTESGFVLDSQVEPATGAGPIYALDVYFSEDEMGPPTMTVYPNNHFNSNDWFQVHKNMTLLQVTDYVDFTGYVHDCFGYVHTNFASGNVGSYYLWMN